MIDEAHLKIQEAFNLITKVNENMCVESRWNGQADVSALKNSLFELLKSQAGSIGGLVSRDPNFDLFWKFVTIADYASANFDHEKSKDNISIFNRDDINSFYKDFNSLINSLKLSYQKVDYTIGFGDDGMDDMYAYIISQGKNEYQSYIDDPEKFREWNVNSWKPESFIYIFN